MTIVQTDKQCHCCHSFPLTDEVLWDCSGRQISDADIAKASMFLMIMTGGEETPQEDTAGRHSVRSISFVAHSELWSVKYSEYIIHSSFNLTRNILLVAIR